MMKLKLLMTRRFSHQELPHEGVSEPHEGRLRKHIGKKPELAIGFQIILDCDTDNLELLKKNFFLLP